MKSVSLFVSVALMAEVCLTAQSREIPQFAPNPADWENVSGTHVSWATTDFSFNCHEVPEIKEQKSLNIAGWRGEKVLAKALIWTAVKLDSVNFTLSDLVGRDGSVLKASDCEAGFMINVVSDYDDPIGYGCNKGKPDKTFDSGVMLVPDMIDPQKKYIDMPRMYTQSIWIDCPIPSNDYVGEYKGSLTIRSGGNVLATLPMTVRSCSHVLPAPREWKHYSYWWMNFSAIAEYYHVPYYSKAHFKWTKLVYKRMLQSGQTAIRCTIGGSDQKRSMVKWTLLEDGTWDFDYTLLDKFVEFSVSCGMDGEIDCCGLSHRKGNVFQYTDAADGQMKKLKVGFDDSEYEKILVSAVKSVAQHAKEKGWYDRLSLSTDELKHDQNVFFINTVRNAAPGIRIQTAINHPDAALDTVWDAISYATHTSFTQEALDARHKAGKRSTQYVCCSETHPNRYVFSDPYECTYFSYNTFLKGLDGFLCWSFSWWGPNEMQDTRRRLFYSGEYQMIYPYDKTSQRWEKFIEGIQDYEKLHILTKEYEETGNKTALKALNKALAPLKAMTWNDTREDIFDKKAVPNAINAVKALMVK